MRNPIRLLLAGALLIVMMASAYALTPSEKAPPEPLFPPQETGEKFLAYLTGYAPWDNTPPGTTDIAFSSRWNEHTFHEVAGGTGTYKDPITLAVGHVILEGTSTPDFAPGTRFYIPNVQKYFVVEDVCGDGDTPQDGPCHRLDTPGNEAPKGTTVWLDLWIGGDVTTDDRLLSVACMEALTGAFWVVKDPLPNYAVTPGPLFQNNQCTEHQFGNRAVLQQ